MAITASRYHDISVGHRVTGHESKCRHLHGHNYRIHFDCEADALDDVGRVIDFSVIKERLCMWVEEYWDHKFLVWEMDPLRPYLLDICRPGSEAGDCIVSMPFNPTAENMAEYLLKVVGPSELMDTGVRLVRVVVEETRKCQAEARL